MPRDAAALPHREAPRLPGPGSCPASSARAPEALRQPARLLRAHAAQGLLHMLRLHAIQQGPAPPGDAMVHFLPEAV